MNKRLVSFCQTGTYWFLRGLFPVILNKKVAQQIELPAGRNFILVSNHQSHYDPFIIFSSLPYSVFKQLRPAAFMTKNRYTDRAWKRFFTGPLGMFPAHENPNYPAGIDGASQMVNKGFTLVMFPEGKIGKDREHVPRTGAIVIAASKKLSLLPIRVKWDKKHLRRKVSLAFGEPIAVPGTQDYEQSARNLMDSIYSLPIASFE